MLSHPFCVVAEEAKVGMDGVCHSVVSRFEAKFQIESEVCMSGKWGKAGRGWGRWGRPPRNLWNLWKASSEGCRQVTAVAGTVGAVNGRPRTLVNALNILWGFIHGEVRFQRSPRRAINSIRYITLPSEPPIIQLYLRCQVEVHSLRAHQPAASAFPSTARLNACHGSQPNKEIIITSRIRK